MKAVAQRVIPTYDASGAPLGGVALSNRSARGGSTTVHGWPAVFIGLLVTGAMLALAALALGLLAPGTMKKDVPGSIVAVAAGIFALAGMSATIHGARGVRRMARVSRLRAAKPGEP